MYYEEKVMNGKLYQRTDPNGEWREVSYNVVMQRMLIAEKIVKFIKENLPD